MNRISLSPSRQLKLVWTLILLTISISLFFYIVSEPNQNYVLVSPVDIFDPTLNLPQDDNLILNVLLEHHLVPPPSPGTRKLSKKVNIPSTKSVIQKIFKGKKNGFFIECGANDGEFLSYTLGLEVDYDWTGLLVEASPKWFEKLKSVKRNAWITNLCLSGAKPQKIEFIMCNGTKPKPWNQGQGKIKPQGVAAANKSFTCSGDSYGTETIVKCFPLFSILSALNVTYVDYFSLDVEGHEYKILEAIPFDRLYIKVIQVEYWITPEGKDAILNLLVSKGYTMIYDDSRKHHEFVFVKND